MDFISQLKFDEKGLIPVIAQDFTTGQVLMLAYANKEAIEKTLELGTVHYFSRSRNCLWHKGDTSGHFQHVKEILYDCDGDTILLKVIQDGAACILVNTHVFTEITKVRRLYSWTIKRYYIKYMK